MLGSLPSCPRRRGAVAIAHGSCSGIFVVVAVPRCRGPTKDHGNVPPDIVPWGNSARTGLAFRCLFGTWRMPPSRRPDASNPIASHPPSADNGGSPAALRRAAGIRDATSVNLLGRPVVARGCLQLLDVRRRQLRPIDCERQLVELAGEAERHLVVLIVHRRPSV